MTSQPHDPNDLSRKPSNSRSSASVNDIPRSPTSPQPFSTTFFSKDPQTAAARATFLKILISGSALLVIIIFSIFPIYWGALWKVPVRNLPGWIVVSVIPIAPFIHSFSCYQPRISTTPILGKPSFRDLSLPGAQSHGQLFLRPTSQTVSLISPTQSSRSAAGSQLPVRSHHHL